MRKLSGTILFLWLLTILCINVRADDLPATMYLEQRTFTSTGRVSADGQDGVYEFELTYPNSNTTVPRYYIFSSATTATNAKKGTYKIYGASPIADGTNVQPADGVSYPVADISSADDAAALINADPAISSFLPLYCYGASLTVTLNLNTMTVAFRYTSPAQEAPATLGIFNKSTSKALGIVPVDAEGVARFSYKNTTGGDINVYFAADAETRAATNTAQIWGAADQTAPANVAVAAGNTYPLKRTTYYQVYTASECSFTIPAGNFDIIADTRNGTVEFKEFSGAFLPKPAKLNMRSHTVSSNYASDDAPVNGVYKMSVTSWTGKKTSEPIYVLFTDATSYSGAQTANWVLGASDSGEIITPEFGKKYPLVQIDPVQAYESHAGCFAPIYPQAYDVVADLNDMTVTFTPQDPAAPLQTLYLFNDSFRTVGAASPASDGKFHYSLRAKKGDRIILTTSDTRVGMGDTGAITFGANGHANAADASMDYGSSRTLIQTSYYQVYINGKDFVELPGRCELTFDPATQLLTISPYTGENLSFPETLYLRSATLSALYAEAQGNDGVYIFDYETQSSTASARYMVITDAESKAEITPSSWVIGGGDEQDIVLAAPGMQFKFRDLSASDLTNRYGAFCPLAYRKYTLTVDMKNETVTWGEPDPEAGTLFMLDDDFTQLAEAPRGEDGVYTFRTRTYSSHPLFFSDATSRTDIRTSDWIFMGSDIWRNESVDIETGSGLKACRGFAYSLIYNSNTFWSTPEGVNTITARLDTRNNTIDWTVAPFTPRDVEMLYVVDDDLNQLARCANNGDNTYHYTLTTSSTTSIAFADSPSSKGDPDRVFRGSYAPYTASNRTAADGAVFPLVLTSEQAVADNSCVFRLSKGRWKVGVDLNANTVSFTDISHGDNWHTPDALTLADDNLTVIAQGVSDEATPGVFTFAGVAITSDSSVRKIVFMEPGADGTLYGANSTGDGGQDVESGQTYGLYSIDRKYVVTDGAGCFRLVPSTYNITVDFNEKSVRFFDPTLPVYPESLSVVTADDEPAVVQTATGSGQYKFVLRTDKPVSVTLASSDGAAYGLADPDFEVKNETTAALALSEEPNPVTIPAGIWTVSVDLTTMTAGFVNIPELTLLGCSMEEGAPFHSYFGAGTDPRAVFTFSTEVASVYRVYLALGDYSGGIPKAGDTTSLGKVKASIDSDKVIIDFSGEQYVLPEGAEPKAHLILLNVQSTDGEVLKTDDIDGLPDGSIVMEYPFEEFGRISVQARFNPASGSGIDDVSDIEMSINPLQLLTFTDVVFVDSEGNAHTAVWKKGETDADGFTTMKVRVPMAVRGLGNLKLRLADLDIDDTFDNHADDVEAEFIALSDPTVKVTSDPLPETRLPDLNVITLTWTDPLIESVGNRTPAARIVNAATDETVTDASYSYPAEANSLTLTPAEPITETGRYRLEIAAGDLLFNDDPDSANNPLQLTFDVDSSLCITGISVAADEEVTVADTAGRIVRRGVGPETLRGLRGIYIVNGVKVILSNNN